MCNLHVLMIGDVRSINHRVSGSASNNVACQSEFCQNEQVYLTQASSTSEKGSVDAVLGTEQWRGTWDGDGGGEEVGGASAN